MIYKSTSSYPDINMDQSHGLNDATFIRFYNLIQSRTGIKITKSKRAHIEGKLKKRARSLKFDSISEYGKMVFDQGGLKDEIEVLIHLATTNKTDFFREPVHFNLLEKKLVPQILSQRARNITPRLKIWSAAASNGAEAYTLAMVLKDLASVGPYFDFSVLGTDISSEMIIEARRAIYPIGMMGPVPQDLQRRYFMQSRDKNGPSLVRVVPEIRQIVRFKQLNLISKSLSVDQDIDIIFLRNVLI
jgi:chemotaxis protein methyltransferase CheR